MAKTKARIARNNTIIKWLWHGFFAFWALVILLFILIYNGIIGYMPPVAELKNPTDNYASTLYTSDGKEMGRVYRSKGNRVYVDFDQMSNYLKQALIATEDARFDEHSGIDARAIARSVVKRIFMGQTSAGGGSTITQQLAKQLYSPSSNNIVERAMKKPIEWIIAIKLERYYTKDEIMKMYFNQFDFLNNAVGIKSASYVYFGKSNPNDLNLLESATLVGMCKNPSYFNPLRYPERTKERRNIVLDQMVKAGYLKSEDAERLKPQPIQLAYHKVNRNEGIAPYMREEIRRMMMAKQPRYKDYPAWNKGAFYDDSTQWVNNPLYGWCNKNHKSDGSNYDIYTDGLRIYTTIDSKMQEYAEQAVRQHLSQTLQPLFVRERGGYSNPYTTNTAQLSPKMKQRLIDRAIRQSDRWRDLKSRGLSDNEIMSNFKTKTEMHLFSYNGDIDKVMTPYDSVLYTKTFLRCGMMSMDPQTGYVKAYVGGPDYKHFKYDMVSTGRRQIGSTVKPFLYTLAMENGMTPCDQISNARININGWSPRGGGGGGLLTMKSALTMSNNTVSARLIDMFKPANLVNEMHNFGISNKLDTVAALCLGPCEVSVREMVAAYSAFANKGMRSDPIFVTRICDNHGNVLAEFGPRQTEVISEDAYYKMLSMLENVVNAGTGRRVRGYGITAEMGGKTGTTNDNSDGWFMGFTPELVTGVWVGGEERYIHFTSGAIGQGAEQALPAFAIYMKKLYDDPALPYRQDTKFDWPSDIDVCWRDSGGYYGTSGHGGGGNGGGGGGNENHHVDVMEGVFD